MNLSWFAWTFGARNIFFCHFFLKQYFLLKASWNDFTCDIKVFSFLQNLCVLLYPLLLGLWINRFHWSESPWHLWTFVIFLTTFLFFQFCYLLSIAVALSSEQRYAREFGDSWLLLHDQQSRSTDSKPQKILGDLFSIKIYVRNSANRRFTVARFLF